MGNTKRVLPRSERLCYNANVVAYLSLPAVRMVAWQTEVIVPIDGGEALSGGTGWGWFMNQALPILSIAAVALILFWAVRVAVPRVVERSMHFSGKNKRARDHIARRTHTLSNLLVNTAGVAIALIALMTILDKLNVPIAPLLTGAGIAGVAVGLGAQSLVKDLISGIFILAEDQYNRGDVVEVAGVTGMVEEIGFRRTVLRDTSGTLHTIPNSAITLTSNYTRDLSRINLDLPVDYGTDLDRAMDIINRVGEELAKDSRFGKSIISPPKALRVNNFADSGIEIKVVGDTAPGSQWEVAGEFRRRIKQAFDTEGIEISWPRVKLYLVGNTNHACPRCQRLVPHGATACPGCGTAIRSTGS
ncbi:MAG: mechanosensitive ion channel [Dehalococcoidia bacterium]|nr:mechanosensitive ion channel [Dehalococcoidia bacterium]